MPGLDGDVRGGGVSTRKVRDITEELCGASFSKSTVSSLAAGLDSELETWRSRRLVSAMSMETSEEWITGRRYLDTTELDEHRAIEESKAKEVVAM